MRYIIKGGVWKNSEDEILKAAVMKYGLNQWSRISSLLVRKSAKQCKQRWYEWLDPSIKKTEWTREEQEKLLHLAKIFPSQWRTIAPMVGRTPMQCVEQYEKLLDQAQGKDLNDPNDPRRLRPGEIDPNPETKPARPDPIDMDEDEKEMLAEARVRLANTKGKKAKRKARGKLIEEARRLALLQKKRELKAAGIQYINHRIEKHHIKLQDRKYKGINYNRELAFERMVPEFAHDNPLEEDPEPDKKIANVSLQTMEGQRRDEEEEIRRKIDQRRIKKLKERELDQAVLFQNKHGVKFVNQTKLTLPEPQLKDQDLELLGKLNAVNQVSEYTNEATRALVGNYSTREQSASVMRTPRAPNTVLREASNIIALQHTETPLVGGHNAQLTDVASTNLGNQTPNQLASLLRTPNVLGRHGQSQQQSVRGFLSEQNQTPVHDAFKLNLDEYDKDWDDKSAQYEERLLQAQNEQKLRDKLTHGLKNLPKPKNEFTIDIPQLDQLEEQEELEMDAEEKVKIQRQKKKQEIIRKHKQRSLAYQKNLPTPKVLPQANLYDKTDSAEFNEIQDLLNYHMMKLIKEDQDGVQDGLGDIKEADRLLQEEIALIKSERNESLDNVEDLWNKVRKQCVYDHENQEYVFTDALPQEEIQRIEKSTKAIRKSVQDKLDKKIQNLVNKNTKIVKGYEIRIEQLAKEISILNKNIADSILHKAVYLNAMNHERQIYRDRLSEQSKYHDMLLVKSNELQSKYESLIQKQRELEDDNETYFEQQ